MARPSLLAGGWAGMSTANTVLGNDGSVVLLDKSSFCGGDSTVGNGRNQWSEHENTAREVDRRLWRFFTTDTLKGGEKKLEFAKVL